MKVKIFLKVVADFPEAEMEHEGSVEAVIESDVDAALVTNALGIILARGVNEIRSAYDQMLGARDE